MVAAATMSNGLRGSVRRKGEESVAASTGGDEVRHKRWKKAVAGTEVVVEQSREEDRGSISGGIEAIFGGVCRCVVR